MIKALTLSLVYVRDVFVTDGSRVSAATVASTAIAAAQWAVTQVKFDVLQHIYHILNTDCMIIVFILLNSQTSQNGPGGGQSVDTSVYQQGAAVTYSQEGLEYAGQDGTTFKPQADNRVTALTSGVASLNGAYAGGAAPGLYDMPISL